MVTQLPDPARAAANQAQARVEESLGLAQDRLHLLNGRLLLLRDEIKSSQPVANGAVCLELYPCGPGCAGCPHPRWMQYRWTPRRGTQPGQLQGVNLSKLDKDPALVLRKKDPNYRITLALIREAKAILEERSALIAIFRSLHPFAARAR